MGDDYAYVGTFTTAERGAHGAGIHVFRIDRSSGQWTAVQTVGGLVNPSFLVVAPGLRRLFAVHGDQSHATAFALDTQTGRAVPLGQAVAGGHNGVRHAIDPAGRFMVVANYGSGSVAVLPIRPDGGLADARQVLKLEGSPGPHKLEQASAHPHDVCFDPSGRLVVVPDKGLDRVFVLSFDPQSGRVAPAWSIPARPGAGPRHAAFHPDGHALWVLNELDSTVATYAWTGQPGGPHPLQIVSTLPDGSATASTAAEIAVSADGRFVYCSNRGHDSIAVFGAEPGGLLRPLGWQPSGGRGPRFIGLDPTGHRLYAANEQSGAVVAFPIDPATGLPGPAAQALPVASPAVIAFFDPDRP